MALWLCSSLKETKSSCAQDLHRASNTASEHLKPIGTKRAKNVVGILANPRRHGLILAHAADNNDIEFSADAFGLWGRQVAKIHPTASGRKVFSKLDLATFRPAHFEAPAPEAISNN